MKKETMNGRNYSTEKENVYCFAWWGEKVMKKEDLQKEEKE